MNEERSKHDEDILQLRTEIRERDTFLRNDLSEHYKDDENFQKGNSADVSEIKSDIKTIKENHLAHIQVDMAKVTTNVEWIMKSYWIVATAAVGSLVVGLIGLLVNK